MRRPPISGSRWQRATAAGRRRTPPARRSRRSGPAGRAARARRSSSRRCGRPACRRRRGRARSRPPTGCRGPRAWRRTRPGHRLVAHRSAGGGRQRRRDLVHGDRHRAGQFVHSTQPVTGQHPDRAVGDVVGVHEGLDDGRGSGQRVDAGRDRRREQALGEVLVEPRAAQHVRAGQGVEEGQLPQPGRGFAPTGEQRGPLDAGGACHPGEPSDGLVGARRRQVGEVGGVEAGGAGERRLPGGRGPASRTAAGCCGWPRRRRGRARAAAARPVRRSCRGCRVRRTARCCAVSVVVMAILLGSRRC